MKTSTVNGAQSTFTYGPDGQLVSVQAVSGTSKYVRDANGVILTRTDPTGATTLYLPGQEVTISADKSTVTVQRYYSIDGMTIAMRVNNNNPLLLMSDLHASNEVAVDPVTWTMSRRYLGPFGNVLAAFGSTWQGDHGFLGKSVNATTGLTDMGAREYDPTTGRFTSVDPVLTANDPRAANGYTYADNNPLGFSDPTGLMLPDLRDDGDPGSGPARPQPQAPVEAGSLPTKDYSTRHNLAAIASEQEIEQQVKDAGGDVGGIDLELVVPAGSKKGNGNNGFADITYDDGATIFVWEVKSSGVWWKAQPEAIWYRDHLQAAEGSRRKVVLGWPIGEFPNILYPGDQVWGIAPGAIIYGPQEPPPGRIPWPVDTPVPNPIPIRRAQPLPSDSPGGLGAIGQIPVPGWAAPVAVVGGLALTFMSGGTDLPVFSLLAAFG